MRRLRIVRNDDRPVRGRGAGVTSEVRYRYPAEEIWEVSEHRWQVVEKPYDREKATNERFTN